MAKVKCMDWLLFCAVVLFGSNLIGQEDNDDPLQIADSKVKLVKAFSIGSKGFEARTEFKLQDSAGIDSDIISLMGHQSSRDSVKMTDELLIKLNNMDAKRNRELVDQLGVNFNEAHLEAVKSRFKEIEHEMLSLLTDEQIEGLKILRLRAGLEEKGFGYFAAPEIRKHFGLAESDAEMLSASSLSGAKEIEKRRIDLLKIANRALFDELKDGQKERFNQSFKTEKSKRGFFCSDLFRSQRFLDDSNAKRNFSDPSRLLKLRSIRSKIELSDSQYAKVLEMRSSMRRTKSTESHLSQLRSILNVDQMDALRSTIIERETARTGTVAAMCYGQLGEVLQLSDQQSRDLFEYGRRLHECLSRDLKKAQRKFYSDKLADFPDEKREMLLRILDSDAKIKIGSSSPQSANQEPRGSAEH